MAKALDNRTNLSGFQMLKTRWPTIQKPDKNCVRKITIRIPDSPELQCIVTVFYFSLKGLVMERARFFVALEPSFNFLSLGFDQAVFLTCKNLFFLNQSDWAWP
jgi:hypothetical protein